MNLHPVDTIFHNFRLATMANPSLEVSKSLACVTENGAAIQPSGELGVCENVAMGVSDGIIKWIVDRNQLENSDYQSKGCELIDGNNRWMTPGLIDCHTHLVYGGNRAGEWVARLSGTSYAEIAKRGGGILSTVKQTRTARESDLVNSGLDRLREMINQGVTTVEIKSGYGLDLETELKMLSAADRIAEQSGIGLSKTFLGAHAIPPEFQDRSDAYIDLVCREMIPAAKGNCQSVDVFCESIAFDLAQSTRVLETGLENGLYIKAHAEQLKRQGMAVEAAKMGAVSVDHLEFLTPADCEVLAENQTVATLLPGAFYTLNETQKPPVTELVKLGVPIAVATDCNPGSSPMTSILLAGNMACVMFGISPQLALLGVTRNAARALRMESEVGTLAVGMRADLAIWNVEDPCEIFYGLGQNPCLETYIAGKPVIHASN